LKTHIVQKRQEASDERSNSPVTTKPNNVKLTSDIWICSIFA